MRNWFENLSYKLQRWMYGRYGYDELSKFLNITAIICLILSIFVPFAYTVGLVLMVWSMFRTYSKNAPNRLKERDVYLRVTGKIRQFFKVRKNMWRERNTHRYYKCPGCKVHVRVPKGKGKIEISCPKCKTKIIRTT